MLPVLPEDRVFLYGLHTVEAAFRNPARLRHRLLATRNALERLKERGIEPDVPVEDVHPRDIDLKVGADAVHQGLLLECDPLAPVRLSALGEAKLVLVLDQVTDPHNTGAILRSAVALGADALLTTTRHAARESGVLAKAASGAVDILPHAEVVNLAEALKTLGELGYTRIALDSAGPTTLEETPIGAKVALVLGSEGKGVRPGVRAACDHVSRLDMPGPIASLNVSNAAVLALYVVGRALAKS